MERAQANAVELVQRLRGRPEVSAVRYPGFGAIIAIELTGGEVAAELLTHTTPCGCTRPASAGSSRRSSDAGAGRPRPPSIDVSLVRMSVGLEHVDDLWDDLEQALDQLPG